MCAMLHDMAAAVIPIDSLAVATPSPQKRWGFSQNSYSFKATKLIDSDRYRDLDRKAQYARSTQHDFKRYDFDGRSVRPGPYTYTQPLMSTAGVASPFYVPLRDRRPCAPLRLGKQIVGSFTKIVLGEDRWPDITCREDEDTQDFVLALAEAAQLPVKMILARNRMGAQGVVGVSWYFHEGLPVVEVHDAKVLHVHEWADISRWKPRHVTKCYKHVRSVWDPQKGSVLLKEYWYRRDWTPQADVFYKEVEVKGNAEPAWEIDEERSDLHGDGSCHFVWVQNVPDAENPDSEPDYDGQYDKLDELDTINSVICRGAKLNLDPTLKLRMEPEAIGGAMVKKGSDHALVTGKDGDASYMELAGTALEAGGKLVDRLREQVLAECECVIPDPNEVAAGSVSSVALQMIYAPMLAKRGLICATLGESIKEVLTQMLTVCRARWKEMQAAVDEDGNPVEEEVANYLVLPPKAEQEDVVGEDGQPTGEVSITFAERQPGMGTHLELAWGPPFKPNGVDIQNVVTTMSTAVGAKAVLSVKAAVEVVANLLGKDPAEVLKQMDEDGKKAVAMSASMLGLPPTGEPGPDGLPPTPQPGEGEPAAMPPPGQVPIQPGVDAAPAELSLTSSDLASIVTVNEARARYGMPPMKEDGELTLTEFKAKRASTVAAAASADKGTDPNKPPPPPHLGFGAANGPPPGASPKPPGVIARPAEQEPPKGK